jgi:hypothetical protein
MHAMNGKNENMFYAVIINLMHATTKKMRTNLRV